MKKMKILSVLTIIMIILTMCKVPLSFADETEIKVNLTNLTYTENGEEKELKRYSRR